LHSGQLGGDGVSLVNAQVLYHDGFPFIAGSATGQGAPGQAVGGAPVTLVPRLLSELELQGGFLDRQVPAILSLRNRPFEFHFLALAFQLGWFALPGIPEPIFLFNDPNWQALGYLAMDAQGQAQMTLTAPADVNLIGLPVVFQSFGYDPAQVVVSPAAAAVVR